MENEERVINNCLGYFPETKHFKLDIILDAVGQKAFAGTKYPANTAHANNRSRLLDDMASYLIAHEYVEVVSGYEVKLTAKGRKLKKVGDIREYERHMWWARNWKWIASVFTIICTIIKYFFYH